MEETTFRSRSVVDGGRKNASSNLGTCLAYLVIVGFLLPVWSLFTMVRDVRSDKKMKDHKHFKNLLAF